MLVDEPFDYCFHFAGVVCIVFLLDILNIVDPSRCHYLYIRCHLYTRNLTSEFKFFQRWNI
jgi:hypothetical protein